MVLARAAVSPLVLQADCMRWIEIAGFPGTHAFFPSDVSSHLPLLGRLLYLIQHETLEREGFVKWWRVMKQELDCQSEESFWCLSLEPFRKKLSMCFSHATQMWACFKMGWELLVPAPFLHLCFVDSAC